MLPSFQMLGLLSLLPPRFNHTISCTPGLRAACTLGWADASKIHIFFLGKFPHPLESWRKKFYQNNFVCLGQGGNRFEILSLNLISVLFWYFQDQFRIKDKSEHFSKLPSIEGWTLKLNILFHPLQTFSISEMVCSWQFRSNILRHTNFFPITLPPPLPHCNIPLWFCRWTSEPREVTKPALITCRTGFSLFPSLSAIRSRDSFFKRVHCCFCSLRATLSMTMIWSVSKFMSFFLLSDLVSKVLSGLCAS